MIRFILFSMLASSVPCGIAAREGTGTVSEITIGSFSSRPDGVRNLPTIEASLVLVVEDDNSRHYRVDSVVTHRHGPARLVSADSRDCPAVLDQMAKVANLPMPAFVAPDSDSGPAAEIKLHPTRYTLGLRGYESVSGTGAHVELRAESGSPLAQWAEETFEALEQCWSVQEG